MIPPGHLREATSQGYIRAKKQSNCSLCLYQQCSLRVQGSEIPIPWLDTQGRGFLEKAEGGRGLMGGSAAFSASLAVCSWWLPVSKACLREEPSCFCFCDSEQQLGHRGAGGDAWGVIWAYASPRAVHFLPLRKPMVSTRVWSGQTPRCVGLKIFRSKAFLSFEAPILFSSCVHRCVCWMNERKSPNPGRVTHTYKAVISPTATHNCRFSLG